MDFLRVLSNRPININLGLLLVRVGIGTIMLVAHGYGKITGGPEVWAKVGGAMGNLGVSFAPAFWGFLAAFAEFVCSILIVLGVLFRPATALLAFTMFVAALHHLNLPPESPAAGLKGASHALKLLVVFLGLLLTGPGRFAFRLITRSDLQEDRRAEDSD